MRDDWWWPWWVSSLIDLGVVAIAVLVFVRNRRTIVRRIAVLFALGGAVAAILAPVVMTDTSRTAPGMEENPAPMTGP